ncbi:M15 family metallopeptidase [Streptomyces diastaticus]
MTLVDQDGHELDLGIRVNASPEESHGACFTHATNISDRARHHRTLLLNAMESADFTNYGTEFWYFSAADRYHALMRQEPRARYGPIQQAQPADSATQECGPTPWPGFDPRTGDGRKASNGDTCA